MKLFQRKKEDFVCENCGKSVCGNGYTNHCRMCLWSKHVDINPGDRAEECCGMMEPVGGEVGGGKNVIIHSCVKCGFERKNKLTDTDNMETFIKLIGFTSTS